LFFSFFSYPPDKRPNFHKLGSATPFEAPWSILVHDWSKKVVLSSHAKPDPDEARKCQFYVLREPARLAKWRLALENLSLKSKDLDFSGKDEKALLQIQVK
jgi:hypothetical protein